MTAGSLILQEPSFSPLAELKSRLRGGMVWVGVLSAVLNILLLSGSVYMMLVYDMVLPSRSIPTLMGLLIMVILAYSYQGFLETVRARIFTHLASTMEVDLTSFIHKLVITMARGGSAKDPLQPIRDLEQMRAFLSGAGPMALMDLPWMFFFIIVLFLLHPLLGITVFVGSLVLIGLTVLTNSLTAARTVEMTGITNDRTRIADTSRRHAEALYVMGMEGRFRDRWTAISGQYLQAHQKVTNVTATMSTISKMVRLLLQSLVLTVGALLVMNGQASGGVIFASSILSARAFGPVELVIGNWKGLVAARDSWTRLQSWLPSVMGQRAPLSLKPPLLSLSVENLSLAPAGSDERTVTGVTFLAKAGEAVAVLGPSGCGKSTLVRGLAGILSPLSGSVRLDGAALDQWDSEALGQHIGYVPQNVELLTGTIAQNIARFEPNAPSDLIIAAARQAGVHDLILHLPEGYETQVGNDGSRLSAGQRQRIALARALYRDPFLIILDEPNSNLDIPGEEALGEAVSAASARGAIVIVVAHRPSILRAIDIVLLMRDGRVQAYGPKEKLVPHLLPDYHPAA
ncbi:type I secretion system permease/ATPase [Sphingobium limneticum]|uniref:type I secretion system permease/ATPase n=1 Tax=Sphingobium limneticum TaxID=1007511 RepID=UPI00123DA5D0|nr:type I secretion system permease/ATPase [Sphingobium limneticum]KAA9013023.1 type I secretion system permease/ATPase [Sphingobium limneticum]